MKLYKAKYRTVTEDTMFILADDDSDADKIEDFQEMEESVISREEWQSTDLKDITEVTSDDDPDLVGVAYVVTGYDYDIPHCPTCHIPYTYVGLDGEGSVLFSYGCGAVWSTKEEWVAEHTP